MVRKTKKRAKVVLKDIEPAHKIKLGSSND